MAEKDLKAAAAAKKKQADAANVSTDTASEQAENTQVYDDDEAVIGGLSAGAQAPLTASEIVDESAPATIAITEDDLRTVMPDLDDSEFAVVSKDVIQKLDSYKKTLMIKNGFTPEEAAEATRNRMNTIGEEINSEYLKKNPKLGIVEVDKKNVDKLEFTDEEKAKLHRSKAIRLIAVEDQELSTIKIAKVTKNEKANFFRSVEGCLSKYSAPMPLVGDYMTFRGAQVIQLMSATKHDDDTLDAIISKKASLIYDRLYDGVNFRKYDDNGAVIMTYVDFVNKFKFNDLDMAMYAVLVASSMEESEIQLTCNQCNESFPHKYNLKTLLRTDGISDEFKEVFNDILVNKSNPVKLNEIYEKYNTVKRFKSPYTGIIYDIAYPSVARAIRMYTTIDQTDETMVYLSAFGVFINSLAIKDPESNMYMQIESDDITLMLETLLTIPQRDIDIIYNEIRAMVYSPTFVLASRCPKCGNPMENALSIDNMIFQRAQDSFTEMR